MPLVLSPSHGALELSSATMHVAEHRYGKIRGGGAAIRCAPPYFDHCLSVAATTASNQHAYPQKDSQAGLA